MLAELKALRTKHYLPLALYLASVSLASQYRDSFLGWIWTLLRPTIQISIYALVFSYIIRFPQENYTYYLVTGILPWTFFTNSLIEASTSLLRRSEALKRCVLPRTVFPLSDTLKHAGLFGIAFMAMYVICLIFLIPFHWTVLLTPIAALPLIVSTLALSVALSFVTPYIRDVHELLQVGFSALFFLTPIVYPLSVLPERAQFWFSLNPVYWLIEPIRAVAFYNTLPSLTICVVATIVTVISSGLSFLLYRALRRKVIFYL